MTRSFMSRGAKSRRIAALATASSLALAAVSQPAFAQDADPDEEEEESAVGTPTDLDGENVIIVTGYAQSLETAQDIKREADTVVDVISAEDIGALPDRSVAEALQRVPGVNIGRFESPDDPDRFSVEGTGVLIRGLPFTRTELNGRDIFSANGGRALSFEDVSPELLGRVEVYKNVTADLVEGGIAGTVNLVTRKPLDKPGFTLAGTVEATVGDLREEVSPGFSLLGSNTWDTEFGTFGLQLGVAYSELRSRTDASQVTDPCYRDASLTAPCLRPLSVNSDGFFGGTNFDSTNFPPANTVIVPKGAGVRTTDLDRDREAYSAVFEFESIDSDFYLTVEYLRADTSFFTDEVALLALVNDDALFPSPAPGTSFQFDGNGVFESGILTQNVGNAYATPFGWGGIPLESLRFQRATESYTEDLSLQTTVDLSDRLSLNFEAQYINSGLERNSIIGTMSTWADIVLDNTGDTPQVQFQAPMGAPADYFTSGEYTYYWFLLDSIEQNDGDLLAGNLDLEYEFDDDSFIRKARFGARWSDRDRITRNTNFSTWGNLSAPWAGRAGCAPWGAGPGCFANGPGPFGNGFIPGRLYTGLPGQEFAIAGGAFTDEFPNYSQYRDRFSDGFQRGNAPTPIPGGGAFFFGGDDFLGEYLRGESAQQAAEINEFSQTPNPFFGVQNRSFTNSVTGVTTACDPFCPPEISDVVETTEAAYARIDYGSDFGSVAMSGNIGVRYVRTTVETDGVIGFPNGFFFDDPNAGGNGDGIVQVSEIQRACATVPPGQVAPGYCSLPSGRLQEFADAYTGEVLIDDRDITFDHWLPSFNIKFDFGSGFLVRGAVSKNINRPDLQLFTAGGAIVDNTGDLLADGTLANGPLFQLFTGNRNVRPVEAWNYDLSLEWYFADVGSLTVVGFIKDLDNIVSGGVDLVNYSSPSGVSLDVEVNGPSNALGGTLKGFEIAHQQQYDFLPGVLSGLGSQFTYTYIDAGDFSNPDLAGNRGLFSGTQPLQGVSQNTINATIFYELGPISARAAYNWRDEFLITPRDSIFPFAPIVGEATGQLDASIFFTVNENLKLGVQGVNLLDEVTRTSQVVDFAGTRVTRSAFRNDRRFTFLARFEF